jgi:type VI protein secretion system component Hcp
MALDAFLELTKNGSPVAGESLDRAFRKAMAITSFWIGSGQPPQRARRDPQAETDEHADQPTTIAPNNQAQPPPPARKPQFPLTFRISKDVDAASKELFLAYCRHADSDRLAGDQNNPDCFDTARVTLRKAGGKEPLVYLVLEFGTVFVNNYELKTDSDKLPIETITFGFRKCKLVYTPQRTGGTGLQPKDLSHDFDNEQK